MRLIVRRLLTAAAVLAAAALMLVPAAPAQAGAGQIVECTEHENPFTGGIVVDCNWVAVEWIGPNWPPTGCPPCSAFFDFWKSEFDPVAHEQFNDLLGKGLDSLSRSHLTQDVKLAAQLRTEAAGYFLDAAKTVEKYPIELYRTGLWDHENQKFVEDSSPQPWLPVAGAEIAAGIGLLQADLWEPQPDPPIEAAMQHFDTAYENLSDLAAQ